jgi:hypothetical protein
MRFIRSSATLALLGLVFSTASVSADALTREQCEQQYAPRSGQPGKDVIWVPTREELVMAMLKAANVTEKDFVVDLGSGDGRIPIAAAKHFGARALGLEYNPKMVELAQCNVRAEGVQDKVEIRQADIFETDFSKADVVTMYLLSGLNLKLRPTILAMKPGTRVVSNSFDMGEWKADQEIDPAESYSRGYLWIVPAQVAGRWRFREEGGADQFEAQIEQTFQEITVKPNGSRSVRDANLRGADIRFTVAGGGAQQTALAGKVEKDRMTLTSQRGGKSVRYVGERIERKEMNQAAAAR